MSENGKIGTASARKHLLAARSGAHAFIALTLLVYAAVFPLHRVDAGEEEAVVTLGGRQWATQTNGPYIRWPDAVAYCDDLRLGNHEDWRLPTLMELEALYDPGAEKGISRPISIEGCCLWSNTSLEELPAEDGDEIAGRLHRYRWGSCLMAVVLIMPVPKYGPG